MTPRLAGLATLAVIFLTSGVFHFLTPAPFTRIVPSWIPRPGLMVAISGAAEIAGALGLLAGSTRRLAGLGLILLLVAVFPANIQMLIDARRAHAAAVWQAILWVRLPFQPLLIWLAWAVAAKG